MEQPDTPAKGETTHQVPATTPPEAAEPKGTKPAANKQRSAPANKGQRPDGNK